MKLEGKVVLLTGATGGIGWEILRLLVKERAKVVAVGRDEGRLREISEIFPTVKPVQADLRDERQRAEIVSMAVEGVGGVDVLINNAGYGMYGDFRGMGLEDMKALFEVNFWSAVDLTRKVLPFMGEGGVIANVVSMIAFVPLKYWAVYAASKSAMRSFFMAIREEVRGEGIRVINVYPPVVNTPFFDKAKGVPPTRRKGVPPERVAKVLIDAIKKGRQEVFLSFWDALLAHLGFLLGPLSVRLIT